MDGKTFQELEDDVRNACRGEGIILTTVKSEKVSGNGRYQYKKFKCQRGVTNRQADYLQRLDYGKWVIRRRRYTWILF